MKKNKKSILVVDFLIDRIIFFIEMFGQHNLDIIENSFDAIDYIKEKKYDYILLSGHLLDNDNCINVAEFLHKNPNINKKAEIIVYSWDLASADKILALVPRAKYLPFNENVFCTLIQ